MPWVYIKSELTGETVGPVTDEQFLALVRSGSIKRKTKVNSDQYTSGRWAEARHVDWIQKARQSIDREAEENATENRTPERQPFHFSETLTQLNSEIRSHWKVAAILIGAFPLVFFTFAEAKGLQFLCYPALVLLGAGIAKTRSHNKLAKRSIIAATVVLILAWGYFDTYEERWSTEDVSYVDTRHLWTNRHTYRQYSREDARPFEASLAYGPIAGTGKLHGQWTRTYFEPEFNSTTTFYWYGEVITEGEWHLRN